MRLRITYYVSFMDYTMSTLYGNEKFIANNHLKIMIDFRTLV